MADGAASAGGKEEAKEGVKGEWIGSTRPYTLS